MAKDSIVAGIIVALVGGLLLLVIGEPVKDIITPPEAVPIAQYNERFCPTSLYTPGSFSVKFQNLGDDGSLYATFFSDKLLSRADNTLSFGPNSTKLWIVSSKQFQDFSFEIKKGENINQINNFTVSLDYGCYERVIGKEFYCKQYRRCCNYQREQDSNFYNLVDELC